MKNFLSLLLALTLIPACKEGGDPPELVGVLPTSRAVNIAVDDGFVYAAGWDDGSVLRMSDSTGESEVLYETGGSVTSVLVDGSMLYWSTRAGEIWRGSKDGSGEPELVTSGIGWAYGFRVDGDKIYSVDFAYPVAGAGRVFVGDAGGDMPSTPLADIPTGSPIDVLEDGSALIVSAQLTQVIYRTPKDGGESIAYVDLGDGRDSQQLAGTAQHFYTASHQTNELLEVVDGEVKVFYDGSEVQSPTGVAIDDAHLYWSNYYTREIWRAGLQ